jgi:2,4-dienoyl-CoA reductase-like NADH-dependent reductase (Old Yellow Enzyme family)
MPVIQAHFAEPLLQPFQLRHLTLRNRTLSTAHAPGFAEQGHCR